MHEDSLSHKPAEIKEALKCLCSKTWDTVKHYEAHLYHMHNEFSCPDKSCNKQFKGYDRLKEHVKEVHKVTNQIQLLQQELRSHPNAEAMKTGHCCPVCHTISFTPFEFFKQHLREHHVAQWQMRDIMFEIPWKWANENMGSRDSALIPTISCLVTRMVSLFTTRMKAMHQDLPQTRMERRPIAPSDWW